MPENPTSAGPVLALYCTLILLASLAGGYIPTLVRLTHTRMQVATSFVAGMMLGVGVLHMIPHSYHYTESLDRTVQWLVGGFLFMFFLQRFFHFHHHDVPDEDPEACGTVTNTKSCCACHDHEHKVTSQAADHHPHEHTLADKSARHLSWGGAALGLTLHTLIDGIALGASVEAELRTAGSGFLLGLSTFLVIILHKPFDALAISTLMAAGGWSKRARHTINGLFALAIPAGVALFYLGASQFVDSSHYFLGACLAVAGGAFLCIATSDLLPELQFHSHDRGKLSAAMILGLGFAVLIGNFETCGHDHGKAAVGQEHREGDGHDHEAVGIKTNLPANHAK